MMIDTILNLLFRCPHRRLTRPVTPVSKGGVPQGDTYVVCLDCGKQFAYDLKEMRIGKALSPASGAGVLPPNAPMPRKKKLRYAFWASVPVAFLLGSLLKSDKPEAGNTKQPKPPEGGG
jgi:hypothetical protein